MNLNANTIQILIVALFILAPAIKGVANWLQQQAAKNKAELERKRRTDETLRTGRSSSPEPAPSRSAAPAAGPGDADPDESFAARRRRQLEELRRREAAARQQRETASRQGGGSPGQVLAPTPGRPPGSIGGPLPGSAAGQGGVIFIPDPASRPSPERSSRTPQPQPTRLAAPTPAPPIAPVRSSSRVTLSPLSEAPTARKLSVPVLGGRSLSRAELRQAVVLSEILAPPIASRSGRSMK